MLSVKPELGATHRAEEAGGEHHRRDHRGSGGHDPLDALVVHAVPVVDHVDAEVEGHVDGFSVGDVPSHLGAPQVGGLDARRHLLTGHLQLFLGADGPVPAGDEHLDHLGALLDLGPHRAAEVVGTVARPDGPEGTDLPVGRIAPVTGVSGGTDVPTARNQSWPRDESPVDGHLHGGIDGERSTRGDGTGEPTLHQETEAVHGADGLQSHRLLQPEGSRHGAEVVVRGVEVAVDHARHDCPAREVDHPVVGSGFGERTRAHRGDPVAVHHHMGVVQHPAVAVDHGGVGQGHAGHGSTTTLMAPEVGSAATRKASGASSSGKRCVITAPGRSGVSVRTRTASSNSEPRWVWP